MVRYEVTDEDRDSIERMNCIENVEDACTIARVLSLSNDKRNAQMYFVEDEFNNIKFMYHNGVKFVPEIPDA